MKGVTNTKYEKIHNTSSRVVLFEKVNSNLVECLSQLIKVSLFSTTIIPLPGKSYLVYQRSTKAAYNLFGTDRYRVCLARVIILNGDGILSNAEYKMAQPRESFPFDLYSLAHSFPHSDTNKSFLFLNGNYFAYSDLVLIPISAQSKFIDLCMSCHFSKIKYSDSLNRDEINLFNMEDIPVLRVKGGSFDINELVNGRWPESLDSNRRFGKMFLKSQEGRISLFRSYIAFYDKGLWEGVTNQTKNLNHLLNRVY